MLDEQRQNQWSAPPYTVPPQGGMSPKSTGSVVGIVIIIIVLAFGGFYFWGKRLSEETSFEEDESEFFEEDETSLLVPAPGSSGVPEMIVGDESALPEEEEVFEKI